MTIDESSEINESLNFDSEDEEEIEVKSIANQGDSIWYSDIELEQLFRLQLSSETEELNSGINIWARATNCQ